MTTEKIVQLSRDPFARHTILRETVPARDRKDCAWCGNPAKFRYGCAPDSGRTCIDFRQFCSKSCCDTYYQR